VSTVIHAPPTPEPYIYEEWKRQQNQPATNLKNHHENVNIIIIFELIKNKINICIIFFC
jgi:hypothetical protein